ncbi:MAG: nicotinate-nucleotide adenylyltransferase [Terriglobia bacterium]
MNIALFGGTFDPIHLGHLEAARQAARRFKLDRVLFVPSGLPPHKPRRNLTPFEHRFAMVSLACAAEPRFVPSLVEAPDRGVRYSVDTARQARRELGCDDRLFFLVGLDAFLDLPQWKQPARLLDLADFVVVSRPGFRIEEILSVIPRRTLAGRRPNLTNQTITLRRSRLHLLNGINVPAASHDIRRAVAEGRSVTGLIPPLVEEYMMKEELYRTDRETQR